VRGGKGMKTIAIISSLATLALIIATIIFSGIKLYQHCIRISEKTHQNDDENKEALKKTCTVAIFLAILTVALIFATIFVNVCAFSIKSNRIECPRTYYPYYLIVEAQ
jgi:uncharacterized BrkB/YihY/UPF0761 family membrane protein